MRKALVLLAVVPLIVTSGLLTSASAEEASASCGSEGGETVSTTMIPIPGGKTRARGLYLYASASPDDGLSGAYAETNGRDGLQITDVEYVCGSQRALMWGADQMLLEYAPRGP